MVSLTPSLQPYCSDGWTKEGAVMDGPKEEKDDNDIMKLKM
jgi:hypothetical protein